MLDREPPIFSPSSEGLGSGLTLSGQAPRRSWSSLAFLTLLGICMSFAGLVLGFMYGDSFGRRNAQYDNPALRDYYAGKCYDYWENQIKQTLNSSLQEDAVQRRGQGQKLDEIFAKMQDLEKALGEYTAGGKTPPLELDQSSVAAAAAAKSVTTPRKL